MGKSDVRKPPVEAIFALHPQETRGICRWCGKAVTDKTETGKLRWWHDECEEEYLVIIRPDTARRAVFARDKGICADCEEDWSDRFKFIPEYTSSYSPETEKWERVPYIGRDHYFGPPDLPWPDRTDDMFALYCSLAQVSLWHVDHKTPLWKVRHMLPLRRIDYFKLANLITRCHRCHQHKSNRETMERAKLDGLAKASPEKKNGKWPKGRKIQGRPFQKGHRPMKGKK